MVIAAEDTISRCIIFSKAFQGSIHVDSHLFIFAQTAADGASHESAVLRSIEPTDEGVNRIGCSIAAKQNADRGEPLPGPKRKYYCGFRSAVVRDLMLRGDKYEVKLTLDGEGGVAAHVDVALLVESDNKNERVTIKVDAGLALAEAFGPVSEWICTVDREDFEHPLIKNPDCLKVGMRDVSDYQAKRSQN